MNSNSTCNLEAGEFSKENLVYCQESDMGKIAKELVNEITFYKVATKSN